MCLHSSEYRYDYLGGGFVSYLKGKLGVNALEALRKPAVTALKESSRFSHPIRIEKIAEPTKPFLSMGNQYGEGWFLCGEMIELLNEGIDNIVCIQPFGCLPNSYKNETDLQKKIKAHLQRVTFRNIAS